MSVWMCVHGTQGRHGKNINKHIDTHLLQKLKFVKFDWDGNMNHPISSVRTCGVDLARDKTALIKIHRFEMYK